jgi:NarL family two-component system response regulator LiaR
MTDPTQAGPASTQRLPSPPAAIRVVVADDHAIVRKGIRALLATVPDIEVVGEAADGRQALVQVEAVRPDVILMDLVMPGMGGLEATRQITLDHPETRVLVLTSFAGDNDVFPAIRAGALGYLLKDSSPQELVKAIRQVHKGESSLHPSVARKLLRELSPAADAAAAPSLLTNRETEVLQLVAQGCTNRQIAEHLCISEATIRTHMSKILAKLKLGSRTQAALYALREGIATLHDDGIATPEGEPPHRS